MTNGWSRVEPGVVAVRGADARRWCNGLFTNNLRDLPVGAWNRSALVDDRARIFGFADVLCVADDELLAVVDGMTTDAFLAHFDRYLLFDRVELVALPWERWTALGDAAPEWPRPDAGRIAPHAGGWVWAHRRSPGPSFEVIAPAGAVPTPTGRALDPRALEVERVLAAVPRYPADTGDKRLPHELGARDELLHFEKGCYLGQETIHRIDVMGQVRRRLVRVATPHPASSGAAVVADGQDVGTLTSPVELPDGTGLGLAVVRLPFDAPGTPVEVGGVAGQVV